MNLACWHPAFGNAILSVQKKIIRLPTSDHQQSMASRLRRGALLIWNYWQLDQAFDFDISASTLSTPLIAKILTINRCTAPCSHYSIPRWAQKTALDQVLDVELSGLNDDKIYYEMDKIHENHFSIENYLFKQTYTNNAGSYQYINYDLSTSYFVGYKCKLSAFGTSSDGSDGNRYAIRNDYGCIIRREI